MIDFIDEIEQEGKKFEEAKARYKKELQKSFERLCKKLFEEFPNMRAFSFSAYTPYWNDGDACVYEIQSGITVHPFLETEPGNYDGYYKDDSYNDSEGFSEDDIRYVNPDVEIPSYYPQFPRWMFAAGATAARLINSIDIEVLQDMFGDHVEVEISRDGVVTTECYHD